MQMFLFCAAIEDTCIVLILTISTLSSLKVLAKNREHMSKKVRYMQSQINRLMFAEVGPRARLRVAYVFIVGGLAADYFRDSDEPSDSVPLLEGQIRGLWRGPFDSTQLDSYC